MEKKIISVKEKLNNAARYCQLENSISRVVIWSNGVGFVDLHVSPVPFLFFENISGFVDVISISFDINCLRIGFTLK